MRLNLRRAALRLLEFKISADLINMTDFPLTHENPKYIEFMLYSSIVVWQY